jgi:hypothetical protein
MIYARVSANGDVIEFPVRNEDPMLRPDQQVIPEDCVEVDLVTNRPADDWRTGYNYTGVTRVGAAYVVDYIPVPRFLDDVSAQAHLEMRIKDFKRLAKKRFDSKVQQLLNEYPEREILSWDQQLNEAKALIADPAADVPFINAIVVQRNITAEELANRIIVNANNYALAFGSLLGIKQSNDDIIATLEADTTNKVNWHLFNELRW